MEPTGDPLDDPAIRRRVDVLTHLRDGTIDLDQAAAILVVSGRQVRRLLAAWLESGALALVHGNRGRRPANRTDAELRTRILELVDDRYEDVNRAHLAELLEEPIIRGVAGPRPDDKVAGRPSDKVAGRRHIPCTRRGPPLAGRAT